MKQKDLQEEEQGWLFGEETKQIFLKLIKLKCFITGAFFYFW
jgi:hypothetical protein